MPDIYINDIGDSVKALIPNVLDDHCPRKDAARVGDEIFQQRVFLRGKLDALPCAFHLLGEAIQFQIGYTNHAIAGHGSAPKQGLRANQQFSESKWFGQVVVSTGLEVSHFVRNCIASSENQHRYVRILRPNPAKNFAPIQFREHKVENHQVIVVGSGEVQPRLAVERDVNRKPLRRESASDKAGNLFLVFHQKDAHRVSTALERFSAASV